MAKAFSELTEQEILALAIGLEEEDAKIYGEFAERLKNTYPETAKILLKMRDEEIQHAKCLLDTFRENYGDHIPYIRPHDVKGFLVRKPLWMSRVLTVHQVRKEVEAIESISQRYYEVAAKHTTNVAVRKLLNELAWTEAQHEELATTLVEQYEQSDARKGEDETARRNFVLQVIQPGLAGLMDGSVSTLAPVFAAAFAMQKPWYAFLVGIAASLGAGISMAFAEALSDDGVISGRGKPLIRGLICGLMTALGGVGHTLPFLIPQFHLAMIVAVIVVVVELAVIAWIRHRYMDTPLLSAAFQVCVGGALVFVTGILIGSA